MARTFPGVTERLGTCRTVPSPDGGGASCQGQQRAEGDGRGSEGQGITALRPAPRRPCSPPSAHTGPPPADVLHIFGVGAQVLEAQRSGFGRKYGVLEQFPLPQTELSQVLKALVSVVVGVVVLAHALGLESVLADVSRHPLTDGHRIHLSIKRQITPLKTRTKDLCRYSSEEDI